MKMFIIMMSLINAFLGMKYLCNAAGILQNSKYARTTDGIFAFILLLMCAGSLYLLWGHHNDRWALVVALGPWIVIGLVIFFSMVFGKYQ